MIYYERDTTVDEYAKMLQEHSYTPNLDVKILELFSELKECYANFKAYQAEIVASTGVTKSEARIIAREKFPFIFIDLEIEKMVKIKEASAKKQKKAKELKEWCKGFDRYGRYKN